MAVYFFQVEDDGPIKIGFTDGVADRFSASQMAMPYQLHVRGVIFNGNRVLEQELHVRFQRHWIRGEWFMPHPDLLEYIREYAKPYARSRGRVAKEKPSCKPPRPPKPHPRPVLTLLEKLGRGDAEWAWIRNLSDDVRKHLQSEYGMPS